MKREIRFITGCLGMAVIAGACGKQPVPVASAPVAPAPLPPAVAQNDDSAERAAEAAELARREAERVRSVLQAMVFFDYDQSLIRDDSRRLLDEKVGVLRDSPAVRLRVEGHADERGSTEYNIALASRRATSVVNYLVGFGISAERFETSSYGEERPLSREQNEQAWSQNRRAEFVVTAGVPGVLPDSERR
jgi:peptidoglycan-associated lipoprotein